MSDESVTQNAPAPDGTAATGAAPAKAPPPTLPKGRACFYILSAGDDRAKFDAANDAAIDNEMRSTILELLSIEGVAVKESVDTDPLSKTPIESTRRADIVVILPGANGELALRTFEGRQCDKGRSLPGTWAPLES